MIQVLEKCLISENLIIPTQYRKRTFVSVQLYYLIVYPFDNKVQLKFKLARGDKPYEMIFFLFMLQFDKYDYSYVPYKIVYKYVAIFSCDLR
jgi:hypothetical protein